jgi:hypothetical protein
MVTETPSKFTIAAKPVTTNTTPQNSASMPFSTSDFTMKRKRHVP